VRQAIRPCWNVDPGAMEIGGVMLDVVMRRDGTVQEAVVSDRTRYANDRAFRSAADRALRAVLNPTCQPWPLPQERWPDWQFLELNFDPRTVF